MRQSRRIAVLMFCAASLCALAAAPSLLAKGTNRGVLGGANGGNPDDPTSGSGPALAGYPGSDDPSGDKGPGAINFGTNGGQQREIHRDLFARRCREEHREFREERNRRTAEPATAQ